MKFYSIISQDIEQQLINLTQVTFEITDACNLNCRYCCYGELYEGYDDRITQNLSFSKVRHLLDFLFQIWKEKSRQSSKNKTYISFYGGEPLLNIPLIRQTIAYVENTELPSDIQIVYSMTTNGMLLDKYMDFLYNKKIKLLVSLDGDESSSEYRTDHIGNNSFKRVFGNLKKLQSEYPDYFKTCVNFNTVLHNKNSVIETTLFIKKEFDKTPNISEISDDGIKCGKEHEFNCMHTNYTASILASPENADTIKEMPIVDANTEELREFIETQTGNFYKDYNYLLTRSEELPFLQTGTCLPFSKKIFVTVNGKILPCERISHDFYYGQVTDDGVTLNCEEIAAKVNALYEKIRPLCSQCSNVRKCPQCMYKIKNLLASKPVCEHCQGEKAFTQYVGRNIHYLRQNPHLYKQICNQEI